MRDMGWKKTVARLKQKIPSLRQTLVSSCEIHRLKSWTEIDLSIKMPLSKSQ